MDEYKYIIELLIFRIIPIFKINISASWKDAIPFGGCDGVTSEENWCAKLGFIDDVIDLMPCMCVCEPEITLLTKRGLMWTLKGADCLVNMMIPLSIILLFSMDCNLFAFWCIFRPLLFATFSYNQFTEAWYMQSFNTGSSISNYWIFTTLKFSNIIATHWEFGGIIALLHAYMLFLLSCY